MTEAEKEDLEVRKRRAEGTPCNKENFLAWKKRFEAEMAQKLDDERELAKMDNMNKSKKGGGAKEVDKSDRPTGYQWFTNQSNTLDVFEAAAENAERDSDEEEEEDEDIDNVHEELFDEDVDLDDLDFDDDEEDDDDEDDEEEDLDI